MAQPVLDPEDDDRIPSIFEEGQLIDRLIEEELVAVSFQPIVDLRTRAVLGHEVLCRPRDGYFRTPLELVRAAARTNRMGPLGRHLREVAAAQCSDWPLFINIDPSEFDAPYLVRPDDPIFLHRHQIYLEITEAVPLTFFKQCHGVLAELRTKSLLLAIDDFGAGFSNLKYIAELEPEFVKLDRELVRGAEHGTRKYELVKSIATLCHHMGAKVIAEGIETVEELKAVIAGGVDYGQGFLLALPNNPAPPVFWPAELPPEAIERLVGAAADEAWAGEARGMECPGDQQVRPRRRALSDEALAANLDHLESALERTTLELAESNRERLKLADRLKTMSLRVDNLQRDLQFRSVRDRRDETERGRSAVDGRPAHGPRRLRPSGQEAAETSAEAKSRRPFAS